VTPGSVEREQLIAAIERMARDRGASAQAHRSALVAVMGAKGGVGRVRPVSSALRSPVWGAGRCGRTSETRRRRTVHEPLAAIHLRISASGRAIDSTYLRHTDAHSRRPFRPRDRRKPTR
jgi:hypothetical protein